MNPKIKKIGKISLIIITPIVVVALFLLFAWLYKKMKNKNSNSNSNLFRMPLKDDVSERKIQTLHPKIREKAREFILKAKENGIELRITSGLRTWEEQDKLYAQGRTAPGSKVTNARGGESNHNYGLAFDVVPMENGKPNYNSKEWNKIGDIGKSVGFKWGGDWKTIIDKPHFEMLFGKELNDLKQLYIAGKKDGDYVNIA
jgi:peptidoglycan L-alanyl-D-glutamate endopeptidase CwlK